MDVLLNKGRNSSSSYSLNFVAKKGNIYVMDNHLAAFWCFMQLSKDVRYELFHVDRHYDLNKYDETQHKIINEIDWSNERLEDITNYTCNPDGRERQVLHWCNYINLFKHLYPDFFEKAIFITHKTDSLNFDTEYSEKLITELEDLITENKNIILNIDMDYFFLPYENQSIQMFSDDYISHLANWLSESIDEFKQVIICLSPEVCGSWEDSIRIANIFLSKFDIDLDDFI